MNTGQLGRIFDEGFAKGRWTAMDGLQGSRNVSAQTARGGWPEWGQASEMDETARASQTGRQLQSHDTGDTSSDNVSHFPRVDGVMGAWRHASAPCEGEPLQATHP